MNPELLKINCTFLYKKVYFHNVLIHSATNFIICVKLKAEIIVRLRSDKLSSIYFYLIN